MIGLRAMKAITISPSHSSLNGSRLASAIELAWLLRAVRIVVGGMEGAQKRRV
jgi:hypothetical protein